MNQLNKAHRSPKARFDRFDHLRIQTCAAIICFFILKVFWGNGLMAQSRQLRLYLKGGIYDSTAVASLDSATFSHDSLVLHRVDNSLTVFEIENINSITFPFEGGPAVSILSPRGSEQFAVGDTVPVRWRINPAVVTSGVYFRISVNNGKNWHFIVEASQPYPGPLYIGTEGTYYWVCDSELMSPTGPVSLISNSCRIQVAEYGKESDSERSDVSEVFSIIP